MPGKKPILLTAREVALLGKVPDSVLARRTGRTINAAVEEREQRAIALPLGPRRWTACEIRMLGKYNDAELGRLRRSADHVRRQRLRLRGIEVLLQRGHPASDASTLSGSGHRSRRPVVWSPRIADHSW
jgi:hypothetical protein